MSASTSLPYTYPGVQILHFANCESGTLYCPQAFLCVSVCVWKAWGQDCLTCMYMYVRMYIGVDHRLSGAYVHS